MRIGTHRPVFSGGLFMIVGGGATDTGTKGSLGLGSGLGRSSSHAGTRGLLGGSRPASLRMRCSALVIGGAARKKWKLRGNTPKYCPTRTPPTRIAARQRE